MSQGSTEIERKFLVVGDAWRKKARGPTHIAQGYLARGRKATIRVRIKDGKSATLTIKSREAGASRSEFEYRVSLKDARAMMALCGTSRIEKQRYEVPQGKLVWEIDVFIGRPDGLVLAEIELEHEDQMVALPAWIGAEVTDDPRYRNSSLVDDA
ncbi:MAG: CYTH domain-containing protein [Devosia nanyangense]|uniref:CYTH domain-containing protein n=1 Tax=Devosia nanyangense TaxID=1228055 RepID=A0A933KYH4_9HYPH|nr:CYTH domain-containing protein [Devosia nanyangense]